MNMLSIKNIRQIKTSKGVTLIELVMVMVLLGIMAVGIGGFVKLTTQTYLNVSQRDELLASARFVIERLNREIRNAVPNSVRLKKVSYGGITIQCIEFLPITSSTIYTKIPVTPDAVDNKIQVIAFKDQNENDYQCDLGCSDSIIIYPLSPDEIYVNSGAESGKTFAVKDVVYDTSDEWTINMGRTAGVVFDEHSPTQRAYIADGPVSYCHYNENITRNDGYSLAGDDYLFPPGTPVLMAESLLPYTDALPTFVTLPPTLQRNALIQVNLTFDRNDEIVTFNQEVNIQNVP